VVPSDVFAEVEPGEDDEDAEGDDFLDDLQLVCSKFTVADPVRGDLKTVFEERNHPTDDDGEEERRGTVLQVTVPCNGHEDVGADKKEDGSHGTEIVPLERFQCGRK
jgi:hypothetical protein